ncbi:two-component system, LytTR family, sensor histidine kinase AgrC [Enterococcus sp. AZ048]
MNTFQFLIIVLAMVVENFSQLFIYSKLINKKIPFGMKLILPIISTIVYMFFHYWILIVILLYFLFVGKRVSKGSSTNMIWFYGVYTTFSYSVFAYLMNSTLLFILGETLFDQYMYLINIVFSPFFSVVCNLLLLHLIRPSLTFLKRNLDNANHYFLFFINVLLTLCCVLQFSYYWIERYLLKDGTGIRKYLILLFISIILLLVLYLNLKTKKMDAERIQQLKDTQLADLSSYVHQIEAIYGELRSFRHDYHNMLISLSESIKSKDISLIEDTYNKILNHENLVIDKEHYSLTRLNNLKTLPIKGVISAHVIQAWQKNIPVRLEVEDVIENESIDILDYVRVVSNLLDNAIEAAEKDAHPFLNIAFFKNDSEREIQLIIENSCSENSLNIVKIFQKGYSTKGTNRGLGLATVQAILQNYQNLSLQTEFQAGVFRQTFVIREVIQL